MTVNQTANLLEEMEELRRELYMLAYNKSNLLTSEDIYEASVNLDMLIVKYLRERYCLNSSSLAE